MLTFWRMLRIWLWFQIRFKLREGVGDWVGRAPWKVEWGGGASVENPHFQRVHYCQLLVGGFNYFNTAWNNDLNPGDD